MPYILEFIAKHTAKTNQLLEEFTSKLLQEEIWCILDYNRALSDALDKKICEVMQSAFSKC